MVVLVAVAYMKDTPWLDDLIKNNAYYIGQNDIKNDIEEHKPLQRVAGIWFDWLLIKIKQVPEVRIVIKRIQKRDLIVLYLTEIGEEAIYFYGK